MCCRPSVRMCNRWGHRVPPHRLSNAGLLALPVAARHDCADERALEPARPDAIDVPRWTSRRTMVAVRRVPVRHPRFHRRILAPIVALMLLVIGVRSAQATYRCTGDGVARTACCCPQDGKANDEAADRETAIDAACCCDIELAQVLASVDVRLEGATSHQIAALPVVQDPWVVPTIRSSQTSLEPAYVHRSSGPPLRLVKQSLLI